jgi:ubiquinone biosynthesis protein
MARPAGLAEALRRRRHRLSRGLRVFLRLFEIAGAAGVLTALALPALMGAWLTGDREALQATLGRLVGRIAIRLGPVTVKLAQMASYRSDLVPEPMLAPLRRLQDDVRYARNPDPRRLLAAALGDAPENAFGAIDSEPIAAGSIAIVLHALGAAAPTAPVAVKLVRPGTAQAIDRDIQALRFLVGMAGRTAPLRGIPVGQTFEQIAEIVVRQSDMRIEGRNNQRLKRILEPVPGVLVPRIWPELTRRDLLVMDLFVGWRKIDDPSIPTEQFRKATDSLLAALFRMIFTHGFIHCDFHPGNILVSPDGLAVLLDGGLVAELDEFERRRFKNFFFAFAQGDARSCGRIMIEIADIRPDGLDERAFHDDVRRLIKTYHGRSAGEFLIAEFVFQIFSLQRRYRLYGTPGFVSAIWALAMFEGLVRRRYPDLDFQGRARTYLTSDLADLVQAAAG